MKKIYFFTALNLIACVLSAQDKPGFLDSSYGENGKVVTLGDNFGGSKASLSTTDDGIISGSGGALNNLLCFFMIKYNKEGSIDSSFGEKGMVFTPFPNYSNAVIGALAYQQDGKIVAVGSGLVLNTYNSNILMARYYPDGRLDSSFGNNGIVITDFGDAEAGAEVAIQQDGKLVVGVQWSTLDFLATQLMAVRYFADGSIDESFGDKGKIITNYNGASYLTSMVLQDDGKILMGGGTGSGSAAKFLMVRLLPDGAYDTGFGEDGALRPDFGPGGDMIYDMALQPDQKIIAAGVTGDIISLKAHMAVARYNTDGSADNSFGIAGKTTITFADWTLPNTRASSVALQADGKIVLGGRADNNLSFDIAVARLLSNGIIDSSFGINGTQVTDMGGSDENRSVQIQRDGKIVLVGESQLKGVGAFTISLARYFGDKEEKNKYVKIKHWLHKHGFTWEDRPGKNNISSYTIERSSNGNSFTAIGQLLRNSSGQYHFEDAAPLAGNNYYRVAAASSSGAVIYSNVLAIPNNDAVTVYPNPAKNSITITGLSATEKTSLRITDLNGNLKASTTITGSSYNWNISALPKGNYVLQVVSDSNLITKKFVKE